MFYDLFNDSRALRRPRAPSPDSSSPGPSTSAPAASVTPTSSPAYVLELGEQRILPVSEMTWVQLNIIISAPAAGTQSIRDHFYNLVKEKLKVNLESRLVKENPVLDVFRYTYPSSPMYQVINFFFLALCSTKMRDVIIITPAHKLVLAEFCGIEASQINVSNYLDYLIALYTHWDEVLKVASVHHSYKHRPEKGFFDFIDSTSIQKLLSWQALCGSDNNDIKRHVISHESRNELGRRMSLYSSGVRPALIETQAIYLTKPTAPTDPMYLTDDEVAEVEKLSTTRRAADSRILLARDNCAILPPSSITISMEWLNKFITTNVSENLVSGNFVKSVNQNFSHELQPDNAELSRNRVLALFFKITTHKDVDNNFFSLIKEAFVALSFHGDKEIDKRITTAHKWLLATLCGINETRIDASNYVDYLSLLYSAWADVLWVAGVHNSYRHSNNGLLDFNFTSDINNLLTVDALRESKHDRIRVAVRYVDTIFSNSDGWQQLILGSKTNPPTVVDATSSSNGTGALLPSPAASSSNAPAMNVAKPIHVVFMVHVPGIKGPDETAINTVKHALMNILFEQSSDNSSNDTLRFTPGSQMSVIHFAERQDTLLVPRPIARRTYLNRDEALDRTVFTDQLMRLGGPMLVGNQDASALASVGITNLSELPHTCAPIENVHWVLLTGNKHLQTLSATEQAEIARTECSKIRAAITDYMRSTGQSWTFHSISVTEGDNPAINYAPICDGGRHYSISPTDDFSKVLDELCHLMVSPSPCMSDPSEQQRPRSPGLFSPATSTNDPDPQQQLGMPGPSSSHGGNTPL